MKKKPSTEFASMCERARLFQIDSSGTGEMKATSGFIARDITEFGWMFPKWIPTEGDHSESR